VREVTTLFADTHLTDADVVLELLHGLPLALTQAGSYMRETNISASTYAKHYRHTWGRLMKKQDRFPIEEYGDRSVLTTWAMSYEQVQRQSEEAAWLLKLWGLLDSGELWYELFAAVSDSAKEMDIPAWLLSIAEDELEFSETVGLLLRYSLADARKDSGSFSMHSVLHKWCRQLAESEWHELYRVAAGLVAANVSERSDVESWSKSRRLLAHGVSISRGIYDGLAVGRREAVEAAIQPQHLHLIGYLLQDDDKEMAMKIYQRALGGKEKAWGLDHTSTLDTVNNLAVLYMRTNKYKEAEEMYMRALDGYEKALGLDHISTLDTVNNLGNLYADINKYKEAEEMYMRALEGKEKA
jgi:tetratricopeptide (TPR) repeat protein